MIGRCVEGIQLHVFGDASITGYGACAYFRVQYSDGFVQCLFVLGKSRVAPLRTVTVPRLELTAAVIAVKLAHAVRREIEFAIDRIMFWTDAKVILHYIHNVSSRYKSFVANRLELIHTMSSPQQWNYVPSNLNAADIASRGLCPSKVDLADMWFNGPPFFKCDERAWPEQPDLSRVSDDNKEDPEVKKMKLLSNVVLPDPLHQLLHRYSGFTPLQRSVSWLLRFIHFMKWKANPALPKPTVGSLTLPELNTATLALIQMTQQEVFSDCFKILPNYEDFSDIQSITQRQLKDNPCLQRLQTLNPCHVKGIIRVGGRLKNAFVTENAKFPILLPDKHHVTNLLILDCHVREGHLGCLHVLNALRQHYWILKGRATVKYALKSCLNCRFWKAKEGSQQMGALPEHRVTPNPPFSTCGTDLMGPIMVRIERSSCKRYVCIFNCLSSRAVHLEVVQSMDTNAFIQAFQRFYNRRGTKPKVMYSDNGGNFLMANKEINKGIRLWNSHHFRSALAKKEIEWRFNPLLASHQGGFYEAFFRIVRKILRSVVGEATLDEFDLLTLLTEIEHILNNRPITDLPSSPNEFAALTPGMILISSVDDSFPPGVFVRADGYKRSWKRSQFLVDEFWRRWLKEYLPLLQPRSKWFGTFENLKCGDLVLMKNDQCSRGCWPKAVVVDVLPDTGNLVRRVMVRTSDGKTFLRDIRKLCLLEGCQAQNDKQ